MGVKVRERDGAWWVFINHNKQRKAKRVGVGDAGKKAAKQVAQQIQARLALGQAAFMEKPEEAKPEVVTVGDYLKTWLHDYALVNCKPSTYAEYTWAVEHVLGPAFGTLSLDQLTTGHVRQLIGACIKDGKAKATIKNYLAPLRAAYSQAVDDGLVAKNPATRLGKLLKDAKTPGKQMQPLTRQESDKLLETAKTKASRIYALLLCALRTGLRQGELIGLQWGDLDLDARYLLVRRSVVRGHEGLPKSGKIRRVDMSRELCMELRTVRQIQETEAIANGRTLRMDQPVFPSPMGFRWDKNNLDKQYRVALKASGIRSIRFHDTRHTFASQLIEQGAHPKYIQEQLGHASITMTMDTYGHLFPNRNRGLVDGLDTREESRNATPAQPVTVVNEDDSLTPRNLVRPTGLEPVTPRSVVWCSIH